MKVQPEDVIGLFGQTDSYRVLSVDGDVIGLENGDHVKLSDVFICASYNEDGTIIKTYWDGMIIDESPDGDYRTRWDSEKLSNLDEMMILLDFLGRDVA